MYETKISDAKWMAYDIPGNVGWIMYLTGIILTFIKRPEYISYGSVLVIMLIAVIPALMMVIGIAELISERIKKLDRILSKVRLYRGFGMLYYGGIAGAVISLIGIICAMILSTRFRLTYLWVMLIGGILCALFAGILFKGYKKQD